MEPKYRADCKGQMKATKDDCVASMRGNIANADCFILLAEDCECYDEYAQYLTTAELSACFKKAMKA